MLLGGSEGKSDRLVLEADGASEDQRHFRMEPKQMVEEEAALYMLTSTQVHRRKRQRPGEFFNFIYPIPLRIHQQSTLFKSHYILLFMSTGRLIEYIHCDGDVWFNF